MKTLYKNENKNIFTFTLLLIVAIMILTLYYSDHDLVFADDTIVQFNQLSNNLGTAVSVASGGNAESSYYYVNISQTTYTNFTAANMGFSDLDSTHYYYYKGYFSSYSSNVDHINLYFNSYGKVVALTPQISSGRITSLTTYNLARTYKTDSESATYTIYFNFIDLTLMYGSGNEPTADECDEIFTANYYYYNEGQPMNTTQLEYQSGYEQGYSDGYSSFTTTPIFTNSLDNITNGTTALNNTIQSYYNSDGSITYTNVDEVYISLLLDESLEYSYRYNVSWDNITCSEEGTLDFEYVLEDGSYSTLSDSYTTGESGSFTFYYDESSTTNTYLYFVITLLDASSSDITFTILNLKITKETDLTTTYNTGFRDGKSKGYTEGYSNGYLKGYNIGFNEAYSRDTTSLVSNFWSWFGDMFTNIGQIFEVELFSGITIGAVILVPLLFSILLLVLKLIRG